MKDKIIRYEAARQLVAKLTKKRQELVASCEHTDTCEDLRGMVVGFGVPCGVAAWEYMVDRNKGERYDEQINYEDSFLIFINDENGACDNCIEAYKIRNGALADAKREFGNAKRSLSYLGKKLIKESK